jgi:hypothetical protein
LSARGGQKDCSGKPGFFARFAGKKMRPNSSLIPHPSLFIVYCFPGWKFLKETHILEKPWPLIFTRSYG